MRVALVTVGDELLAGDTVNTNAAWLGREFAYRVSERSHRAVSTTPPSPITQPAALITPPWTDAALASDRTT
jgi:hypothetical protein